MSTKAKGETQSVEVAEAKAKFAFRVLKVDDIRTDYAARCKDSGLVSILHVHDDAFSQNASSTFCFVLDYLQHSS